MEHVINAWKNSSVPTFLSEMQSSKHEPVNILRSCLIAILHFTIQLIIGSRNNLK